MIINYLHNLWIALKGRLLSNFYGLVKVFVSASIHIGLFKFKHLFLFLILINISTEAFSQAACDATTQNSAYAAPTCVDQTKLVYAGQYENMAFENGVKYSFSITNNAQSDGICINNASIGTGAGPFIYTSSTTGNLTVAAHRTATAWPGTSATITYRKIVPTASNGSTQTISSGSTATLSGNNPANIGTGAWTVVSGPSTLSGQFTSTSTYNTVFTPTGGVAGDYVVRWTVSNSNCTVATADATITVTSTCQLVHGADFAAPACTNLDNSPGFGAGVWGTMAVTNGVAYTLSITNNAQTNGICIDGVSIGTGNGPFTYTATATGNVRVAAFRNNATWSSTSTVITYKKTSCSTITLAASAPAAATVCASSTKVPIQSFSGAITVGTGNLTNLAFTTTGTYAQADITKYQLWCNTSNSLSTATQVGADLASSGGSGARTFAAFTTPTLTSGSTYYFWITVDLASSLTNATIACNATATTDLTYAGTVAGSTSAGGTQTFNGTITLAQPSAVGASSVCASSLKVPIQSFSLAVTNCAGNLTAVGFTTAGTYAQADIAKYQLWKSATDDITAAVQLGADLASSGTAGARSFAAFASPTLTNGSTYYFWITVDITGTPTNNNTISCNAITTGNLTSTSTKAGSTSDAGAKTIKAVSAGGSISPTPSTVCSGSNSTTLTLSGHTGSITKWQSSTVSDFSSAVTDIANTTTSLTATNLTATTYYRAVVTNSPCGAANSASATINVSIPSAQATTFTYTSATSTSLTLGWTRGTGTGGVLVIALAGSAPTDPTIGSNYAANAAYGSGAAVGGGFAIYKGTGTSVALTGLTVGTTYYFAAYEFNTGDCYLLTELTGSTCPIPAQPSLMNSD